MYSMGSTNVAMLKSELSENYRGLQHISTYIILPLYRTEFFFQYGDEVKP